MAKREGGTDSSMFSNKNASVRLGILKCMEQKYYYTHNKFIVCVILTYIIIQINSITGIMINSYILHNFVLTVFLRISMQLYMQAFIYKFPSFINSHKRGAKSPQKIKKGANLLCFVLQV